MRKIFFLTFLVLIVACSSSRNYSEYTGMLTDETVFSTSGELTAKVPIGWFYAVDNENNLLDLWFVKDDFGATVNIMKITLDDKNREVIKTGGMAQLIKVMKTAKNAENNFNIKFLGKDEYFLLGGRQFFAFQYYDNRNRLVRTVLFRINGAFYECSLIPAFDTDFSQSQLQKFFDIQNAVLYSLK